METKNLEAAAAILKDAGEQVTALIGESHNHVALGIQAQLRILVNRLTFLSGSGTPADVSQKVEFPPVTSMLGSKIQSPKKVNVVQEVMDAREQELKNLNAKIDRLQIGIFQHDNKTLLESYKAEQIVIRGLARRAGLEDFKSAELNGEYLDKIRAAFKHNEEDQQKKEEDKAKVPEASNPVKAPADLKQEDNQKKEETK